MKCTSKKTMISQINWINTYSKFQSNQGQLKRLFSLDVILWSFNCNKQAIVFRRRKAIFDHWFFVVWISAWSSRFRTFRVNFFVMTFSVCWFLKTMQYKFAITLFDFLDFISSFPPSHRQWARGNNKQKSQNRQCLARVFPPCLDHWSKRWVVFSSSQF